ncbi:MAG: SPOR domain-containing protein [Bacteroidales bacterium]|nr:SPOR domain-containing protein [Bacteroidales bacterium]
MKKIALLIVVVFSTFFVSCKYKKQAEYIKQLENAVKEDSLKRVAELEALKAEMQAKIDSLQAACQSGNPQGKFCVITGSFRIQQNADNYVQEMNKLGYKAQIVEAPNGFHLVSTYCASSLREALSELNNARSNIHPDSWIYVK